MSYANILTRAKESVTLEEIRASDICVRRAQNSSLFLEVPGAERKAVADQLAGRLREVLGDVASVNRLSALGELRVIRLDDSVGSLDM